MMLPLRPFIFKHVGHDPYSHDEDNQYCNVWCREDDHRTDDKEA